MNEKKKEKVNEKINKGRKTEWVQATINKTKTELRKEERKIDRMNEWTN